MVSAGTCNDTSSCNAASRSASAFGVGLGLRRLALRDTVVREQILVEIRQFAIGPGGGERLLIGADRCGKIRRIHRGQGIPLLHLLTERHEQPRHRAGERRQHTGGLIVVEIDHAGGLDGPVEDGALHFLDLNVPALRVAQAHIAEIGRRRRAALVSLSGTAGQPGGRDERHR